METYKNLVLKIILAQKEIVGPIAWIEARKIEGLVILDEKTSQVEVTGDGVAVLESLVLRYDKLFGAVSREVSRTAVRGAVKSFPTMLLPSILK